MPKDYDRERKAEEHRAWISQLLFQLQSHEWYGSLEIKLEKGVIQRVLKEESLVPPPSKSV